MPDMLAFLLERDQIHWTKQAVRNKGSSAHALEQLHLAAINRFSTSNPKSLAKDLQAVLLTIRVEDAEKQYLTCSKISQGPKPYDVVNVACQVTGIARAEFFMRSIKYPLQLARLIAIHLLCETGRTVADSVRVAGLQSKKAGADFEKFRDLLETDSQYAALLRQARDILHSKEGR